MGCLEVRLGRIGETSANATSLSRYYDVSCSSKEIDASFLCYTLMERVNCSEVCFIVRTERKSTMSVRCGLVCSVNYATQLNIEPKHIWLMPENLFTDSVCVYTEVVWHVE